MSLICEFDITENNNNSVLYQTLVFRILVSNLLWTSGWYEQVHSRKDEHVDWMMGREIDKFRLDWWGDERNSVLMNKQTGQ